MFFVKNSRFFVTFICCVSFVRAQVRSDECNNKYKVPEWLNTSWPFDVGISSRDDTAPETSDLWVQVSSNTTETVSITLFADPFADGQNGCRPATDIYYDLREYYRNFPLYVSKDHPKGKWFHRIFSGCYYIQVTNSNNEKWIYEAGFYNGTHHYYDTKLECTSKWEPAFSDRSQQLKYDLSLGLTCSQLRCKLFERTTKNNQTIFELDHGLITPSQDCNITYEKFGSPPSIKCLYVSKRKPKLVNLEPVKTDGRDGWKTSLKWTSLIRDGAHYYTIFERKEELCIKEHNEGDLITWYPAVRIGAIIHGPKNDDNTPEPINTNNGLTSTVGIVTGVIIMTILIYWLAKYAKIMVQRKHVFVDFDAKPQIEDAEAARMNIGKYSDGILLVYAKGSPQFMKKMEEFRSHLQNTCGSTVHDVYSPDDFPELARVGVSDWIRQRLSGDSKVVWVDTPHFRSLFNGEPHPDTSFRDNAIPYAVKLATDLFQDPVTQYCRHFVVRMESLQVENGHADPLLVISPHKRYYIPQHLDKLCDHLTNK